MFKNNNHTPAVKICGLTNSFEAVECIKSGADAIGLVFYRKNPRFVVLVYNGHEADLMYPGSASQQRMKHLILKELYRCFI